jgi:hypothetical protein
VDIRDLIFVIPDNWSFFSRAKYHFMKGFVLNGRKQMICAYHPMKQAASEVTLEIHEICLLCLCNILVLST